MKEHRPTTAMLIYEPAGATSCVQVESNLSQPKRGHLWYSGSVMDYWLTGRAINPVPGA